jgi:hypothetical protein
MRAVVRASALSHDAPDLYPAPRDDGVRDRTGSATDWAGAFLDHFYHDCIEYMIQYVSCSQFLEQQVRASK